MTSVSTLMLVAGCSTAKSTTGGAPSSGPISAPGKAGPVFLNGQAQIAPAFQDATQWVRQELWVETDFDSDNDGRKDRVHVDVTRPRQTETEGLKVATIYESSPYFAGTAGQAGTFWDVNQELGATPKPRVPQVELPFQPVRPRIGENIDEQLLGAKACLHRGVAQVLEITEIFLTVFGADERDRIVLRH